MMITAVHGRKDPVVPYDGGENPVFRAETDSTKPFRSIAGVMQEWGHDHAQCQSVVSTTLAGWSSTHWGACPDHSSITLFTIDGMGHDLPNYGAGYPIDFGTLILETAARSR
jgi:poly(3-hydroxybutyrate) depolymerase